MAPTPWWERRETFVALMALSALPLLWPDIPPLVDLPGHMGRYRVQLELAESAALQRFYDFEWALIGNLGVDLLVMPLAKVFGLELAVKLIVIAIPPLTVAGLLLVAREVHGRIPPTALFALPFAYNFPFSFGFVNFALSMALALLAFALWLRLARLGQLRLRAALFVPISLALWLVHAFGWGTLGVLAFSAELVRQLDRGRPFLRAGFNAGLHCLALAPPFLLMLLWRGSGAGGVTGDWFNLAAKLDWLTMALRDRWRLFDLAALGVVILVILAALFDKRLGFSRNLGASALFLALVFLLLPRIVFGSAYADMRLAPHLFAVVIIAIRERPDLASPRFSSRIALIGLAFVAVRLAGAGASFWLYDREYDRELAALAHIPENARLVSFVGAACADRPWAMSRKEHLPAMALVRRRAFSNDQWTMPGAQLLQVRYPQGAPFIRDPSQLITKRPCRGEPRWSSAASLRRLPRDAFDYVWLIDPPRLNPRPFAGMTPVWRDGDSVLYRIVDRRTPSAID